MFDNKYKTIHHTKVGRDFTRRLRQTCWFYSGSPDKESDRYKDILSWPVKEVKHYWGTSKVYLYSITDTYLYRLVGEIRRPGRPLAHNMSYMLNKEYISNWVLGIINLDNPEDSTDKNLLVEEILLAAEVANTI